MKETTRIYVFDHASGFDWNIDRATVETLRDQHQRDGWLAGGDAIYEMDVPIAPFIDGVTNDEITDYLEAEDYIALDGRVLWAHDSEVG